VHAGTRPRVPAVVREEEADVVALGGAGDERRLDVHDRGVANERARIDHATGPDLQRRDGDVVGSAVVDATGQVVDARLCARRQAREQDDGQSYGRTHGGRP
jgi:hypothetical protein